MPLRPPRKPPGADGLHDTDRKDASDFLDDGEFIETDDSLISDFDDLEPAKPAPPRRPPPPPPAPRAPRPPSQQMRVPREEMPPPPIQPQRRPPSQQIRTPLDDLPPPPPDPPRQRPAARPPQRAVSLNRPAQEAIAPSAANIGSADTDMAAGGSPDGVRLIVVDGANKGEEYSLERDIISLGRGADNDIVIRDVSVSRKHAKVIRDEGEYRLVDLGSGNGTLLNGRKVTDDILKSGAAFKMGNTVMRFVHVGDVYSTREDVCNSGMGFAAPAPAAAEATPAPQKARQPVTSVGAPRRAPSPGKSKALLLYGSLVVVLFLAAAATIKFVVLAPEGEGASSQAGKGRSDPAQIQKLFDEGIEAFKRQEWKPAGEKFSAILGLEPQNERARQYKSKIEEEMEYQESLVQAKEFIAKKILRAAIENLKKIPAESSYGAEARTMLLSVKSDYVKARVEETKTFIADKKFQAAYDAASEVLTVDPGNPEAVRLRTEAEQSMKDKGEAVVAYSPPKAAKESKPPREKPPRPGKPAAAEPGMDDMPAAPTGTGPVATGPLASKAVGMFRQGNVNGAIQAVESSGSSDARIQKLLGDLRGFSSALQEGETYYRGKQDEGAIKALGRAIQYGKTIAPSGENAYAQKIAAMIADMYYLRGVKAFYKENYLLAAQNFQQALKFKPDHQQSQNKLKEMSAVAGRLYEEGYVLKAADPEGAKKKFQTIIQITPPDNDYHKKAKDWLRKL